MISASVDAAHPPGRSDGGGGQSPCWKKSSIGSSEGRYPFRDGTSATCPKSPSTAPFESWSNIVNCMLPTTYHPKLRDNVYEKITAGIVKQLFDDDIDDNNDDDNDDDESESAATGIRTTGIRTTTRTRMTKDHDQFLSKRPGEDRRGLRVASGHGVHRPSSETLGLGRETIRRPTATFSLANRRFVRRERLPPGTFPDRRNRDRSVLTSP